MQERAVQSRTATNGLLVGFALDDDLLSVLGGQPDVHTAVSTAPWSLDAMSLFLEERGDFLLKASRM